MIKTTSDAQLLLRLQTAHSAVADAYGAREDALLAVIKAFLLRADDDADDDVDGVDAALRELLSAHWKYYAALDQWGPLQARLQELSPEHWLGTAVH